MSNVTKKDLIDGIVNRTNEKRVAVKSVVQEFLNAIIDELGRGNRIELRDFGVFEMKQRAARVAQNPKTLEKVEVPERTTVKFKPGRLMRQRFEPDGGNRGSDKSDGAPEVNVVRRSDDRLVEGKGVAERTRSNK